MLPSAPTVSCHSLRSAPALSASSAGAAAAGLPRGRGTFASGGGMAVARHLATVAGPLRTVRCPGCRLVRSPFWGPVAWVASPLPAASPVPVATALAGANAAGRASGPDGPSGCCSCPFCAAVAGFWPLAVSHRGRRCGRFWHHPAGVCRPAGCPAGCILPFGPCRWSGAPSWRRHERLHAFAPLFQAGLPVRPVTLIEFPSGEGNPLQKLAVTASFSLAFLPPSIPGYR